MKSEVIVILEISVLTFRSDREVISFDSTLEEALSVFRKRQPHRLTRVCWFASKNYSG